MKLNLRKARKLEAKIADAVKKTSLTSSVKVRTLSSDEDRDQELAMARANLLHEIANREELVKARFYIRRCIGIANVETGINTLIGLREEAQAHLANSTAMLDSSKTAEVRDLAQAKKKRLENGDSNRYGDDGISFSASVSTEDDVSSFKKKDIYYKKELENLEDQLAQKNLGAEITLAPHVVELLKKNDLI